MLKQTTETKDWSRCSTGVNQGPNSPILDFSSLARHISPTASAARFFGTAPQGASAKRRKALEKGAMRPLFHVLTAAVALRF